MGTAVGLYEGRGVGCGLGRTDGARDAFPDVGQGPPLDAKLSDDGQRVVFVWADEVTCSVSLV